MVPADVGSGGLCAEAGGCDAGGDRSASGTLSLDDGPLITGAAAADAAFVDAAFPAAALGDFDSSTVPPLWKIHPVGHSFPLSHILKSALSRVAVKWYT